jgi:hypothetical protein
MSVQSLFALAVAVKLSFGQLLLAMAAASAATSPATVSPAIGVVTAKGSFKLDNAPVMGNGTLTDGMRIETGRAVSDVRLVGGVKLVLGSDSRGQIFRNRMILEEGQGQFRHVGRFGIQAGNLHVHTDDPAAAGRVTLRGGKRVQVASLSGSFRVTNRNGVLLAAIPAGHALEFEPSSEGGATPPSRLTGCVQKVENQYFLTDETANITVELKGGHVEKFVGHKVEIVGAQVPGAKPARHASQLVQVSQLKSLDKRCTLPAGAIAGGAAAGGAAAGGAAAGGTAAGTAAGVAIGTKAVVAGVVIAGAATAGAVAATTGDGEDETISR